MRINPLAGSAAILCIGGLDVIRKEAWPFYRTISGVRLCWDLEEPEEPEGFSDLQGMQYWITTGSGALERVPYDCSLLPYRSFSKVRTPTAPGPYDRSMPRRMGPA